MMMLLVVREKRPHETVKNPHFNRKFSQYHEPSVGCGSNVGIPVWTALAKSLLDKESVMGWKRPQNGAEVLESRGQWSFRPRERLL